MKNAPCVRVHRRLRRSAVNIEVSRNSVGDLLPQFASQFISQQGGSQPEKKIPANLDFDHTPVVLNSDLTISFSKRNRLVIFPVIFCGISTEQTRGTKICILELVGFLRITYWPDGWNPIPNHLGWCQKTLQIMGYLPYQLVSRISSINSSITTIIKSTNQGSGCFRLKHGSIPRDIIWKNMLVKLKWPPISPIEKSNSYNPKTVQNNLFKTKVRIKTVQKTVQLV